MIPPIRQLVIISATADRNRIFELVRRALAGWQKHVLCVKKAFFFVQTSPVGRI
jgi:hypothetical protein